MSGRRLRVALDARRMQDCPMGGVGRSMDGVLPRLVSEVDVVLLTDARRDPVPSELRQVALDAPRGAPESVWLHRSVGPWLRSFDGVFHGTFNALPFRSAAPAVVTIHDLSFEVHPEGFSAAKRRLFQLHARHAARVAHAIVTPSRFTRDQLVDCYGVDPRRIVVTPWGVEARFSPEHASVAPEVVRRLGVNGRYVVAMGGAPRRALDVAVAAWRRVHEADAAIALVAVGPEPLPAEPGLVRAGSLDDREWPAVLAGAGVFCYPTRYEGFGVPALESIASGTPIVCAPVGSLPEILLDAAEWCTEPTVDAVAAALERVLHDPFRSSELREIGLRRAALQPTWDQAADALLRTYQSAYSAASARVA